MTTLSALLNWIPTDKVLHFTVSALLYLFVAGLLTVTGASPALWVIVACSTFFALLVGAIKEYIDYLTHGQASWGDILFNALGTGFGFLIHLMF